jgi:hypothetical protein
MKIMQEKRNKLISLWIEMPNNEKWNLWDLKQEEITTNVIDCIGSAYELGRRSFKQELDKIRV